MEAIFQSTHPSWGATLGGRGISGLISDFNPRTHREVRRGICGKPVDFTKFQSTHPSWGATKVMVIDMLLNKDFNPRTHRGVRPRFNGF